MYCLTIVMIIYIVQYNAVRKFVRVLDKPSHGQRLEVKTDKNLDVPVIIFISNGVTNTAKRYCISRPMYNVSNK